MNPDTPSYPDETNSECDTLEYYEPEPERIKEEEPLDEPNPLSNSEIIFGERRTEIPWNPFALEPETELDLEKSFQNLSLNDEPETEPEPEEPGGTMAQPGNNPEVKMNYPKIFTGNRSETKRFIQDCDLYLTINAHIYNSDVKRIGFVTALMTEDDAASWKEQFIEDKVITSNAAGNATLDLGTYIAFKHDLQQAFNPYDAPGDALEKMKMLRMKPNDSIDEHVAKFKMLVTSSGLGKTSAAVIDLFRETLPLQLQRRILLLETPPADLDKWYDWAIKLHHQWKRMQRVLERETKTTSKKTYPNVGRRFNFQKQTRDPNAMDVDALTIEERSSLMKEGRCFNCRKTGHLAKECPQKKNKYEQKKKMNGKELYTHIRGLMKDMDEDEKETFLNEAEEAGF